MAIMQVVARHWGLEVMSPWGGIGRKKEVKGFERGLRNNRGRAGVLSAGSRWHGCVRGQRWGMYQTVERWGFWWRGIKAGGTCEGAWPHWRRAMSCLDEGESLTNAQRMAE